MLVKMPPSLSLSEGVKMLFSSHSPCSFSCQVVSLPRFHIQINCEGFFFSQHMKEEGSQQSHSPVLFAEGKYAT